MVKGARLRPVGGRGALSICSLAGGLAIKFDLLLANALIRFIAIESDKLIAKDIHSAAFAREV